MNEKLRVKDKTDLMSQYRMIGMFYRRSFVHKSKTVYIKLSLFTHSFMRIVVYNTKEKISNRTRTIRIFCYHFYPLL